MEFRGLIATRRLRNNDYRRGLPLRAPQQPAQPDGEAEAFCLGRLAERVTRGLHVRPRTRSTWGFTGYPKEEFVMYQQDGLSVDIAEQGLDCEKGSPRR